MSDSWRPDRERLAAPVYRSLAEQIARAIRDGRLPDRSRLPPQRRLAGELGISVQTVSRAYEELARRDLLSGETGRGTFVKQPQAERGPPFSLQRVPELIDLSILKPVSAEIHLQEMRAALRRLSDSLPSRIVQAFRPESAASSHRSAALKWLKACGVETTPYNVVITNGATSALAVALMTLAPPGTVVATEMVGHHSLKPLASYMGIQLVGLEMDARGLVPEAFERACAQTGLKALFIQPTAINPMATVLPEDRRQAIVRIAEKYDVMIIENDALGPLVASSPPPLFALAPDRTFYVTSFTKIVMPGLRIGYLVAPQKHVATAMNRHLVTSWMATPLLEELATAWVEDGTALALVDWQRNALHVRHEILRRVFDHVPHSTHAEALHAWVPLPQDHTESGVAAHARSLGVAVAMGSAFLAGDKAPYPAIRISLGAVSEEALSSGLATIASVLSAPPEAPLST